ncbi:protein ECERIFERUM 26-like [Rhodamnia argentea]|uniref:Protein ECERIFERUM 26-like n=1 Tax=Rhodamnia argentea TaxID=178133 RepID=A0A8B8QKM9_9MYRT|nr:protein ECERIFERUM 26-like [Rhodamnia argentea]
MVFQEEENLVYGLKLSSVGPARVTGTDVVHEPAAADLAMKLHYLRGVYFFAGTAVEGLTVPRIKESMFSWCSDYHTTSGRFRRSDSGRPYIKCNDCGVRFIEAKCDRTVDEWLQADRHGSLLRLLVSHQVVGPELFFSPTFLVQVTHFNCGGMSVGLSWAHILSDPFSASDCFNTYGRTLSGLLHPDVPKGPRTLSVPGRLADPPKPAREPVSIKRVGPVGDNWVVDNSCTMEAFTFHLSPDQLARLKSKVGGQSHGEQFPLFESLCAILWQLIAKVRAGNEPSTVTLIRNDPSKREDGLLSNSLKICTVEADFSVAGAYPGEIARALVDRAQDESGLIEEAVERDGGVTDYVVYGANLSFVDLEEVSMYGLRLNGNQPIFASYVIEGVGDEGAVFVLPGPPSSSKDGGNGRAVTIVLPENQLLQLKSELEEQDMLV